MRFERANGNGNGNGSRNGNGNRNGNGSPPARRSVLREPLNVGVIGLGYWGPNLLRALVDMPRANVTHICDLNPVRLEQFARRYATVEATTEIDDVLYSDDVDAVVIATPVFTHFDLAARALEAGKHTFVEKPLAPSADEASTLMEMAEERDLLLMCGHTFIYSPAVRAVKELIDSGELGDIYFISSSRVNLGLHQRDVSVVWDLGPHDFSILLYWLGEMPDTIGATGRDSIVDGIADVAFVDLRFPSGVVAHVELSWLAPSKLRRTVVVGSKKMVVYEDGSPEPIRIFDRGIVYEEPESFGEYQLSYRTGDVVSPRIDAAEPIAIELEDFVTTVKDGGKPSGSAEFGVKVVRVTEAADAALEVGDVTAGAF